MKNRDLLNLSNKPAPGYLAFIQGFVNTYDLEKETDELKTVKELKVWLVKFGLIAQNVRITETDFKTAIKFRETLRNLMKKNNDMDPEDTCIISLNKFINEFQLSFSFQSDCSIKLNSTAGGINKAFASLLLVVIESIESGIWSQMKVCCEHNCQWAFFDSSKNHSGRWCSMQVCGSRAKAREYRKRRAIKQS